MIKNPEVEQRKITKNTPCVTSVSPKPYIGNFHETPEYMRDDKLLAGYRINFHSYSQVLKSLFQVHN